MIIEGCVSLVTGGCGGLGRPIADALQNAGAKTIIADYNDESLAALPETYGSIKIDVTEPQSVKSAVDDVVAKYGPIDLLVNCAGRIVSAPFVNIMNPAGMMLSYVQFRQDLLINLDSVFMVTSAVVEKMVMKRKRGCIINISSISARGNEGQTSYSAAKAAVEAMTITWAKELGRFGIRSNAIAPGFVDTPSTHAALTSAQIKHITDSTPLKRLGNAEEIAAAVLALAGNDFINGAILAVNGGLTI